MNLGQRSQFEHFEESDIYQLEKGQMSFKMF